MGNYYILDENKNPVKASLFDAFSWIDKGNNRVVEQTKFGEILVSTVFLAIDHSFYKGGNPILFETMIFGGEHDQFQQRYGSWKEAVKGHQQACEMVLNTN